MKIKTASLLLLAGLLAFSSRAATVITPSYSTSGFTIDTSHDLISGVSPSVSGNTGSTIIANLTDGQAPNSIPGYDGGNTLENGVVLTWDLGAVTNITEIQSYSAWPGDRYLQDYTVDVSVDGSTWTTGVISVVNQGTGTLGGWNNVKVDVTTDNGAPLAAGVRYVRFNFNNQQNSAVGYTEFVVNGGNPVYKAIATSYSNSGFPVDTAPDMIFGHSPTVSGNTHSTVISSLTDGQAPNSIPGYDGNNVLENGVVLTWDLGAVTNITEIQSYTAWPGDRYLQDYTVDVSADGTTWSNAVVSVVNQGTGHLGGWNNVKVDVTMSDSSPLATGVRYVRFNFNNQQNSAVGYTEFVVNGNGPHTPQAVVTTSYSNSGYSVDNSQDLVYQVLPASNGHTGTLVLATLTDGQAPTQIIGYDGNNFIQNGCVLTFDMGAPATINEIQTYSTWPNNGRVFQDYTVDVSLDGTTWSNGVVAVSGQGTAASGSWPGVKVAVAMSDSSPLANNVRYIRFNFPSTQNGGVGYQEIVVNGASFALPEAPVFTVIPQSQTTTNGQSVTFTAHATGYPVPVITWHFVDTNSNDTLLSAVGDTLTLPVADITQNVGHYYAVASNTQGTTNSTPYALLTIIDNGVRITVDNSGFPFAGLGSNDLIEGNGGTNVALNNWESTGGWTVANLTDGNVQGPMAFGSGSGTYGLIGNNGTITYNLGFPCTITGVESWTGWNGGGRDNQNYTFSYSKDGTNYINLWTVANNPNQGWGNDVSLAIAGLTNVVSVRFNFGTQQNGGVAYNELAVYGTVEVTPVAPVFTVIPQSQTGSNGLSVVTFTAHATGIPTPLITWHFVDTNSTDTLLSTLGDTLTFGVTFANAGHYYAVASNVAGTTNSTPSALLTVASGVEVAETDDNSGNAFAALGANDLILGNTGANIALNNFDTQGGWTTANLTDGNIGSPTSVNGGSGAYPYTLIGNNGTITYSLGSGANGTGYDITGIRSLTSWNGGGRCNQDYSVSQSPDGTNYVTFGTVANNPSQVFGNDVQLAVTGLKNVKFIRFNFGSQQNGGVAYTELAAFGQSSAPAGGVYSLTGQPQSQTVYAGSTVTFSAQATGGSGNYTYQWYQNAGSLTGQTNASLTLTGVTTPLSGNTYAVVVNDGVNSPLTSTNAVLSVLPSQAQVLNAAYAPGLAVDGNASHWAGLGSSVLYLDTTGHRADPSGHPRSGDLGVNVRYAWDYTNLFILVQENTSLVTAAAAQEASGFNNYTNSGPYNFDSVAFWMDFQNVAGATVNGVTQANDSALFNPWAGLSSTGRTDLMWNQYTAPLGGLANARVVTSGTFAQHNRVIELALKWTDIAGVLTTNLQPGGDLVAAVAPGLKLGSDPLLVYNDFYSQAFIGAANMWSPGSGVDTNSVDVVLAPAQAANPSNTWNNASGDFQWNHTSVNWTSLTTWNDGDDAIFGPTGVGAVTISTSVTAHSLTFNTPGYSIVATGSNTLTLTGTNPVMNAGCSNVTIGVSLLGSNGLKIQGTAPTNSVTLAGDVAAGTFNNLSGNVDVQSGTLVLAQRIGGANSATVSSGFTVPGINSLDTGATVKLFNVYTGGNTNNNRAGNGQIDKNGVLNLTGGTFDVNGEEGNQQLPAPSGTGLIINGSAIADGGLKMFISAPNTTVTFSGVIADGGPITISPISGKLAHRMNIDLNNVASGSVFELAGANTYTRDTRIGAGLLRMAGAGTLGIVTTNTSAIGLRINGNRNNGEFRFDLNGTSQRVSGLGGSGGIIGNNAVSTTSVLTLGQLDGSTDTGTPSWPSTAANGIIVDNTGTGGVVAVTKVGTNTQVLAMTGANTYSGATTISNGILAFSAAAGVSVNSSIRISNPGKLGLNYAGNQTVPSLYINGIQRPNGVYGSANEPAAIAGTGTITVTTSPVQPVLSTSNAGGSLTFSWLGGAGGYKLQSQTNTLTGTWHDYPGGGSNPISVPISAANGSVFFRLAPAP